ncbi:hypothetical protein H8E06_00775 [bacterium]|nr:hypothetical protein [bacterium]
MKLISLPSYNVSLTDYYEVFAKRTDKKVINDLHSMDLLEGELKLTNRQVKAVLIHHMIQDMCEYIVDSSYKRRNLIVYTNQLEHKLEILEYVNELKFVDFVEKTLKRFSKLLPINIHFNGMNANTMHRIMKDKNGDSIDLTIHLSSYIDKQVSRRLNYTKLEKITKQFGLTFLSKTFFKKVENRQLIFM